MSLADDVLMALGEEWGTGLETEPTEPEFIRKVRKLEADFAEAVALLRKIETDGTVGGECPQLAGAMECIMEVDTRMQLRAFLDRIDAKEEP